MEKGDDKENIARGWWSRATRELWSGSVQGNKSMGVRVLLIISTLTACKW